MTANPFGMVGGGLTKRAGFVQLADALNTGDLAGTWWAMYGDGTMRAGSAVTLVPTGTPTNTVEAGWPVRTYTAAQNDQEPANVALPQSDFSVLTLHRSAANVTALIEAFGTGGTNATFAAIAVQSVTTGAVFLDISDGVTDTVFSSSANMTAGQWALICMTYQRVGGAANNVLSLYTNGALAVTVSNARLAQPLASVWSTNGYASANTGQASSIRGMCVTYKLLSAADIARIYAAVGP